MPNFIPREKRNGILEALSEGRSIRHCERRSGVAKSTILRLMNHAGDGCARLHDARIKGIASSGIEYIEQRHGHRKRPPTRGVLEPTLQGDALTMVALDAQSKLVIAYLIGEQNQTTHDALAMEVQTRIAAPTNTPMTPWTRRVAPYAQGDTPHLHRLFRTTWGTVTESGQIGHFTWKTLQSYRARVAFGICVYNFTTMHTSEPNSPAMDAGLTDHAWSMDELVAAINDPRPADGPSKASRQWQQLDLFPTE